jgi:hypothetical protein
MHLLASFLARQTRLRLERNLCSLFRWGSGHTDPAFVSAPPTTVLERGNQHRAFEDCNVKREATCLPKGSRILLTAGKVSPSPTPLLTCHWSLRYGACSDTHIRNPALHATGSEPLEISLEATCSDDCSFIL